MSLEQKVEELTQAMKSLPAELAGILNSTASSHPETQPSVETVTTDPDVADKGEATVGEGKADSDDTKGAANIAGRKTYVFDKQAKQGQIVEKGEEVPAGEHLQTVGKTNWDKACKKYNLDPATGQPNQEEEETEVDDLDDLGTDADDLGLDDDEEEDTDGVSYDDVKKQMVTVMKKCGREMTLKVFKKFGARNLDEVKKEDYKSIFDLADKQITKAE
jgi:hypothetical protein